MKPNTAQDALAPKKQAQIGSWKLSAQSTAANTLKRMSGMAQTLTNKRMKMLTGTLTAPAQTRRTALPTHATSISACATTDRLRIGPTESGRRFDELRRVLSGACAR